jgi:hypothetical protein
MGSGWGEGDNEGNSAAVGTECKDRELKGAYLEENRGGMEATRSEGSGKMCENAVE